MSDNKPPMVDPRNVPTLLAVTFFLVVLSLLLNFWGIKQTNSLANGVVRVDSEIFQATEESHHIDALKARVEALEGKVTALEEAAARVAAAEDAAEDAAPE